MAASFLPISLLLFIALHITSAFGAVPRLGALDNARFLPFDAGAGFASRWYTEGTPALPAQLFSSNPGYILSNHQLGAREIRVCPAGQHTCVEADAPGVCCENDRYCYLDQNWNTKCCTLGVKCPGSLCEADQLYCNSTSSTTIPATTTTGQGRGDAVTSIVSVSTIAACCNRACSVSAFSCEKTFGGQCCSNGFKCALGGLCIADPVPSTSMSVSTIVPEIPPGCTDTSQFACAETDGGGCCYSGSICTFQSIGTATSVAVCAPNTTFAEEGGSSNGLSSGARAGIGVGVAVGAAIAIAAVTWFCIRRRRRSRTTGTNASAHEMRRNTGVPGVGGDGRSGRVQDAGDSLFVGPQTPYTYRSAFTDATGPTIPPLHEHGRAYSYHLPDAGSGPFTDRDGDGRTAPNPSLATTPPTGPLPSDGSGRFATPGSMPYHPDHILRPVEIGGGETQKGAVRGKENGPVVSTVEAPAQDEDPTTGRVELVGSPLLGPDEAAYLLDKGPK